MKTRLRFTKMAKQVMFMLALFLTTVFASRAQILYTQDASGFNLCDGWAYLDSTNLSNTSSPVWTNLSTNDVMNTGGPFSTFLLCPGDYSVSFTDIDGNEITLAFTIGGQGNNDPCAGFSASMTTTNTDANACNGTASVTINGGTAPFMYNWNNSGNATIGLLENLCAGDSYVEVFDVNGCFATTSGTVYEDSTTGDTIIVFLNNTFPPNSVTDTLPTVIVSDCDIIFDSIAFAMITNVAEIQVGVMVTWSIFDSWGNAIMTYDVPYYNINAANSVYEATLIIFCDGRTVGSFEIHITDQFEFEPSTSSLVENEELQYSFVNPMHETLNIQFSSPFEGKLTLMDMKGAIVFSQAVSVSNFEYNVAALSQGIYVLQIQSQSGASSVRLLK